MNRSDNFNRADSTTTLGTPSDGGSDWSALSGTWGISSNQGYAPGSTSQVAVLESNSSGAEVQYTMATTSGNYGVVARATDGSNYLVFDFVAATGAIFIRKTVAGTPTTLATDTISAFSNGDTVKFVVSGPTLTGYRNGIQVLTVSDSFNQTATLHGVWASDFSHNGRFDTFSITEVAPVPTTAYAQAIIHNQR